MLLEVVAKADTFVGPQEGTVSGKRDGRLKLHALSVLCLLFCID